jgi:hypothetical protein
VDERALRELIDDLLLYVSSERMDPYLGARWLWRLCPFETPFMLLTSAWEHEAWPREEIELEIVYEARVLLRRRLGGDAGEATG